MPRFAEPAGESVAPGFPRLIDRLHTALPTRQERPKPGYDIRMAQEPEGHRDVKTTMLYRQVLQRGGRGVKSPADDP